MFAADLKGGVQIPKRRGYLHGTRNLSLLLLTLASCILTGQAQISPAIITQPATAGGSNATISLVATGTQPLDYSWYFNTTNLVQSSTNAWLNVTNITSFNVGFYLAVVANAYGTVTSSVATLAFPPSVTVQPSNQFVLTGSNATFNVAVSGSEPLTYQWQLNGTNIPNNIITTVAGGGSRIPGDGGPATDAILSTEQGVASDTLGNFYIADYGLCRVQKVDTNGIITTIAGNGLAGFSGDGGAASNAVLNFPDSVALDSSGNLYFAEYAHRIRKVDTNGIITTVAGNGVAGYSGDGGPATNATLNYPLAVALDSSGNLYIADSENNCIREVNTNGIITTVAGNGNDSFFGMGTFSGDGGAATNASLNVPAGVTLDNVGNLYIADQNNARIRRVDTNGIITTVAGSGTYTFSGDGGLATDAGLYRPYAVAVDTFGYMFIADQGNLRIRQVDPQSIITTVAGTGESDFTGDGIAATNSALNYPLGLAFARSGGLLIADEWNNRVRNISLGRSPDPNLNGINSNNAGDYELFVTNLYGSVTSTVAALTVVSFPLADQAVLLGSNATFSATAVGPLSIYYQWRFNGTNLSWATNASLMLTNVQLNNQGTYAVIVSNYLGSITSSNVTLTVTGYPPGAVTILPPYQLLTVGANVSFAAAANGTPPLNYQWQFNGSNINWATNALLILTNAQLDNDGNYTVLVTNYFGSSTGSNVFLTDWSTVLNSPGLTWTNGGTAAWFPETNVTHDGVEAAQSGSVSYLQNSILQTTVAGPGTLAFWWNISSIGSLSFSVNGAVQKSIGGITGWQQQVYYLGSGPQALAWNYTGAPFSYGSNAAWLDQVSVVPGGTAPIVTAAPNNLYVRANANAAFAVSAVGTPPLNYQWQFNAATLTNQTNTILALLNAQPANSGNYSVMITNNYGSISTNANLFVELFAINTVSTNVSRTTNGFQLQLNGVLTANPVVVFASTDLVTWLPIYTNPPTTGTVQVLDVTASNFTARFYRGEE